MISWCVRVQPEELWGRGNLPGRPAFTENRLASSSWSLDWTRYSPAETEDIFFRTMTEDLLFETSGSTSEPVRWLRTPEQLWAEAGAIAELVADRRPEALMSFAPPSHLYGAMATAVLAARLSVPMWYTAPGDTVIPMGQGKRWVVATIPSTFGLLRRKQEWMGATRDVTLLHSTAMLPQTAADYVAGFHPERVRLVEIFGSTETGGVASRTWNGDPGLTWDLLSDVDFADDGVEPDEFGERPLTVSSPRLARRADSEPLTRWTLDDYVRASGARGFEFRGRRGRLVKVNGRRVDLDLLEKALSARVRCQELVCISARDPQRGEVFDVHVVPLESGVTLDSYQEIQDVLSDFGVLPRAVKMVESITRSVNGKVRKILEV